MSGDYSRMTFRAERQYTGVRLQQGRVQLDSDWNEALAIALHRTRTETRDVVGLNGVPTAAPGFALVPTPDGTDMIIGAGRAYVDGKLIELWSPVATLLVPVAGVAGAYAVTEGSLLRQGQWLAEDEDGAPVETVAEILDLPEDATEAQRVRLDPDPGAEVERFALWSLAVQPLEGENAVPDGNPPHLAWLEVVERDITVLDAPHLREPAIGDADTTTRKQLLWRVQSGPAGDLTEAEPPICRDFAAPWSPLAGPVATMAARAVPGEATDRPCIVPVSGGYRGIDNGLWRVQGHAPGLIGTDTVRIKWARDNGMHRTRLTGIVADRLQVASTGRDTATALAAGQWLELTPDPDAFEAEGGWFIEIEDPNGLEIGVRRILDRDGVTEMTDVAGDPDIAALPETGLLRRWDGGAPTEVAPGDPIELEKGIEVRFEPGALRNGDHWTIPARARTGAIEWPADPASGDSLDQPPQGLDCGIMALALLDGNVANGTLGLLSDCRPIFDPLTSDIDFEYLGGDGQEVMPIISEAVANFALPHPFAVGVVQGTTPVPGRLVQFTHNDLAPRGRLLPAVGTDAADVLVNVETRLVVRTDTDGTARAAFQINGRRTNYTVTAELLDAGDPDRADPTHLPIQFHARASVAAEVAFDPTNCDFQGAVEIGDDASRNVQDALDRLCPAVRLVKMHGDGQTVSPGRPFPDALSVGLFWGNTPLANVPVAFRRLTGSVQLGAQTVTTDANGAAQLQVSAGNSAALDEGVIRISAEPQFRLPSRPVETLFRAQFVRSADTSETDFRIEEILTQPDTQGDFEPASMGMSMSPLHLARGITLIGTMPFDDRLMENWYTAEIWLDIPFTFTEGEQSRLQGIPGARAVRLNITSRIGTEPTNDAQSFLVIPTGRSRDWLLQSASDVITNNEWGDISGRLVLHGDWTVNERGATSRPEFLDGELSANLDDPRGMILPTGNGRQGGNLVFPFRLGNGP